MRKHKPARLCPPATAALLPSQYIYIATDMEDRELIHMPGVTEDLSALHFVYTRLKGSVSEWKLWKQNEIDGRTLVFVHKDA